MLFRSIVALAELELDLYREDPVTLRFFRRVFADADEPAVRALRETGRSQSAGFFASLMEDARLPISIEERMGPGDRRRLIDVLIWTLEGIGARWFGGGQADAVVPPDDYLAEVEAYLRLILGETDETHQNKGGVR